MLKARQSVLGRPLLAAGPDARAPWPGPLRAALPVPLTAGLALFSALWLAWPGAAQAQARPVAPAAAAGLAVFTAQAGARGQPSAHDGVVEAIRQTVVAAQVSGAVVELAVKVGDVVKAGQLIARLDARAADQAAAASEASVQAARALQDVAAKEFNRQKQLAAQRFISQAALDRAESEFKATQAQAQAQLAQASAARTQTGFHTVRAPYAGVVSEVQVALGDMAMPGRPLVTVYDPQALRVTAAVPQSVAAHLPAGVLPRVELPGMPADRQWITPLRAQLLPTADAATHTVPMRADLPAGVPGLAPGMYARLWLPQPVMAGAADMAAAAATAGAATTATAAPGAASATAAPAAATRAATPAGNPRVPLAAIVRRAEMTGLYVLDSQGRPLLRQVRLGRSDGQQVEVLAGLQAGEQVVTDPQAAARAR